MAYVISDPASKSAAVFLEYDDLLLPDVTVRVPSYMWMTEKSGYAYNEDSLAIVPGSESKISFDGVDFVADEAALEGEEDYLNQLNSESELNVSNGGDDKIQAIIEHAANGDMSFDDIMAEWNQKWSDAQESLGIEVTEK